MIIITTFKPDYIPLLHEAARELPVSVHPYFAWLKADYTLDDAKTRVEHCIEAFEQGTKWEFAVIESETGTFCGGVSLNNVNRANGNQVNLGYWTRPTMSGRGIATAASSLALTYAFNTLKFERVEIITAADNTAGVRLAQKLGAVQEGVLRHRVLVEGEYRDAVLFSVLAGEWNR